MSINELEFNEINEEILQMVIEEAQSKIYAIVSSAIVAIETEHGMRLSARGVNKTFKYIFEQLVGVV